MATAPADLILIAGLWLTRDVWDETAAELTRRGHRVVVPAIPGADNDTEATLDDQLEALLAAVDASERPVVVGHSAASTLAWLAADRRPEAVGGVVMIGGFPSEDGSRYADLFPLVDGAMGFPGWEPFEGPDADDLDAATRAGIAETAVAVPGGVAHGVVRLGDERRFAVPTTLVCPEFSPADAKGWIDAGDLPELTRATDLRLVDLDSGHWPMVSAPGELARVLSEAAA